MSDSEAESDDGSIGSDEGFAITTAGTPAVAAPVRRKGSKGGRQEDPAWANFTNVSQLVYKCNWCKREVVFPTKPKVGKIKTHLANCVQKKASSQSSLISSVSTSLAPTPQSSVLGKRTHDMLDYGVRLMSKTERDAFEEAIAVFVFSSGLPLNKLSHPSFLEALQILRPRVLGLIL